MENINEHNYDLAALVLAALVLGARLLGVAADAKQLKHQFGLNQSDQSGSNNLNLLKAARYLGLEASAVKLQMEELVNGPFPFLIKVDEDTDNPKCLLVVKAQEQSRFLTQNPAEQSPRVIELEELASRYSGEVILLTKRHKLLSEQGKFGLRWFLPALMKHKKLLKEVLLASFFIQIFALITPLFFQVVIDKVLVHKGLTTLDVLAFGLIVISVFDVVLNALRTYLFSHTTSRVDVVLGSRLFNHLMRLPLSFFQTRQVGTTVARVKELDSIREFITGSALTLCIDLLFTIIFFVVMYFYSPTLTWIVMGSIPFYVVLSLVITPVLRARLDEKFKRGAENQAFLVESISGAETLKSMAVEPMMQRRWEDQLAAYVNSNFRAINLGNIASQIASFISKIVTVLILWVGAKLVITGAMTVGMLIAFNMIAGRVSAPILKLVQLWQDFQQAGISLERLGDILNLPTEPGHNPNRASLPNMKGHVRFENVRFRYRPELPLVLDGVKLDVKPGEIVGIVGRSGSGKSTFAKLVQRLFVPEAGRVLVDGVDLALVDPSWLRRQVGVVLQENLLFNRSVRDNIALAEPGAPIEKVMASAKLAGAHDFILDLPEGYDTLVGEQGAGLSGGQRQRIAIARALITNPRILIFDEATSALDYESEAILHNNMAAISKGRTMFIIAHRLSTVREADRIIVMEDGRIVEQGNHQALIDSNGRYARLHQHQAGLKVVS